MGTIIDVINSQLDQAILAHPEMKEALEELRQTMSARGAEAEPSEYSSLLVELAKSIEVLGISDRPQPLLKRSDRNNANARMARATASQPAQTAEDRHQPETAEAWIDYLVQIKLFRKSDVREVQKRMRRHAREAEEIKRIHMRDEVGVAGVVLEYAKGRYLEYFDSITQQHPDLWYDTDPNGVRRNMAAERRQEIQKTRNLSGLKFLMLSNAKTIKEHVNRKPKTFWQRIFN